MRGRYNKSHENSSLSPQFETPTWFDTYEEVSEHPEKDLPNDQKEHLIENDTIQGNSIC